MSQPPTDAATAWAFLHGLATDDDFRARLASNPRETLAEHGIEAPDELFAAPFQVPSKEQVKQIFGVLSPNVDLESPEPPTAPGVHTGCPFMAAALLAAAQQARALAADR